MMGTGTTGLEEVNLYIKAGVDGRRVGACPFGQRVYMIFLLKARSNLLKFKVVPVNPAKPPFEFKTLGLKHLPAIIHGDEGFDALDDIITYMDERFPGGLLEYKNNEADLATKDFFSRFCFYIKAVIQDASRLTASLAQLNTYLENAHSTNLNSKNGDSCSGKETQYLCGEEMTHLDCEVLPKLQHLRVALKTLKNYDIPVNFHGLWRYLYTAYTEEIFTFTCPCDQEIILHWHDRSQTTLSHKMHSTIAKQTPKYAFDIPVHASLVTINQ